MSDLSINSDSPEFEELKLQSRALFQEADALIQKRTKDEKKMEEVLMSPAQIKPKQALYLKDIIEEESE